MLDFLIQLFCAHFAGDFLLQPSRWVKDKEQNKIRAKSLYFHIAVHFILLLPFIFYDFDFLSAILIIVVTHFAIDCAKIYSKERMNSRTLFLLDQLAHLLVLFAVAYFYFPIDLKLEQLFSKTFFIILCSVILVTNVSSVFIKIMISRWIPEIPAETVENKESLSNAGDFIGKMERLLILLFIYLNFLEGIGFLLTAKSIFRFGDLSSAKDKKLTEYILIGTLLSFSIAILLGLLLKYLMLLK